LILDPDSTKTVMLKGHCPRRSLRKIGDGVPCTTKTQNCTKQKLISFVINKKIIDMFDFTDTSLDKIAVHHVGNKNIDEGLDLSNEELSFKEDDIKEILLKYFLSSFRSNLFYNFNIEGEKETVFRSVSKIFEEPESIFEESINIARHLYEQSNHPKISGGEFYVVYFQDCVVDDEQCDAMGIFKSENKEKYLKVFPEKANFGLSLEEGININKLDKGCLIFNTEEEHGYKVCLVDNISRGEEAGYWKNDFLSLKEREDNFYHTVNHLKMCKGFVEEAFGEEDSFSKTDRIDLLNRSVEYFDKKEKFTTEDFNEEVMEKPELIEAFNDYRQQYQVVNEVNTEDDFEISRPAFKGTKKYLRSVLKLDKNFHVYIHGKRDFIEKGFDEGKGLHYYKLFFEDEN